MHKQRINDGYPKKFINSAIQHTLHTQPQRENTDKYVHIPSYPYISYDSGWSVRQKYAYYTYTI